MLGYIISALIGGALINMMNEEKEKEKERKAKYWKRREALEEFNDRKQEIYNSFSNEFSKQLSEDIDFCKEDFNQYDDYFSYFNEGVRNITEIESKENLFPSRIDNYLKKSSKKLSEFEVNHLNVLLVGPSGVGKSCLINSILELDDDKKAETEIIKPTTKTFKMYESEKKPNIRLIDSRGIEKGDYNIDSLVNEITKYIENQEINGNPDNFIHCIWYCITGTRFEDIEEKTLLKLSSIYDQFKLPIIVVYTQAIIPDYYNAISKEINKISKNIEFIPVIAKDMIISENKIVQSKNLDILLTKSVEKSKNAVNSSVFSALRKIVINEIDNANKNSLNQSIKILNENLPMKKDDNIKIEYFEDYIFIKIFKIILFGQDSNKDLKEQSVTIIKDLIAKLNEKYKEIIKNCLKDSAEKKSNEYIDKIYEILEEIQKEKGIYLENHINIQNMKNKLVSNIQKSLIDLAMRIGIKNNKNLISIKLINLISDKVKNELTSLINDNSTENNLNNKIKNQFQRILSSNNKFSLNLFLKKLINYL
jgi:GTPase SAR1 family protein